MKMLNIACGSRFHKDWTNIDFNKSSDEVRQVNILLGLTFGDNYFDVVYSSHFLEHLTPDDGKALLSEVYRVMKQGGVLRLVVPDLENICREYIKIIDGIGEPENKKNYNWIIIELLDQLVRIDSGGLMARMYICKSAKEDETLVQYIKKRVGVNVNENEDHNNNTHTEIFDKVANLSFSKIKQRITMSYIDLLKKLIPISIRQSIILNTSIGERHLWMYDRHSLNQLLISSGLTDVKFTAYNQSIIPGFNSYHLDINSDGSPYKGSSSLYCEAIKPLES